MPRPAHTSVVRRVLTWAARILGGAVALVFVLVILALLVIDLPWGRRLAARELNAVLAPMFKGKIVVDNIASLGLGGAGGVDAHITAPDGTTVLVAKGVSARIVPLALIASELHRSGPLRINVYDVDVHSIDVSVDTDAAGVLKVQSAFDPAKPPDPPSNPPGRGTDLEFPHITVAHTWVHGRMNTAPALDADLDALLVAVRVPPNALAIDLTRARLVTRGMPQGADAHADLEAHLAMPSVSGASLGVDGSFVGDVGGIPATVHGTLDGDSLDAVLDVPEVAAERIRALAPQASVQRPVALHVEAHGPLTAVKATLHASVGTSRLDGAGEAALKGKIAATMQLDATNVDLRAFSPTAQASNLALTASVHAAAKSDGLFAGDFTLAVPPGAAAGQAVPAVALHGTFDQTPRGFGGDAVGSIAEPGAPVDVRVNVVDEGLAPIIGFNVSTKIEHLSDLKRVPGLGPGSAALGAMGTLTLSSPPSVDATVRLAALNLDRSSVHVDATRVEGHASGLLSDPHLDATVDATGLRASGYAFREAKIALDGSLVRENLSATLLSDKASNVRLSSSVVVGGALKLQGTTLDVWRGTQTLHASIDQIDAGGGRVDVVGAKLTGIGEATRATFHMMPDSIVVQSDSNGIDLQRLGYVLGLEKYLRKGKVGYDVDFAAHRDGIRGTAVIDLTNACVGAIDGLTGHVDTRMDGRKLNAAFDLGADGIGSLHAEPMNVELGGDGPFDAASWRRVSGEVRLNGEVDLAKLIALLPPNTMPLSKVAGKLAIQGQVTRGNGSEDLPDITVEAKTTGLQIATRYHPDELRKGLVLVSQPAWDVTGVDVHMKAEAYGTRGAATFALRLVDRHGAVVAANAASDAVPFKALMGSKGANGGPTEDMVGQLMKVPFTAKVEIPARALNQFPDIVRWDGAKGSAEASITFDGTGDAPKVTFDAKGHDIRFQGSKTEPALEAAMSARYDGARADVAMTVRDTTRELLHAAARMNARVDDFMKKDGTPAWDASASATLVSFPLDAVPMLSDRRMHGALDGDFAVNDVHKDARVKVDLKASNLRVGKQKYGGGTIHVGFDGHLADADVRLQQTGGFMNANAKVPLHWGADVAPSQDPSGPIHATLAAKKFQIGFLAPFLQSVFDSLDGTVDADAQVSLEPEKKPSISGSVAFNDGIVGVTAIGQDLRGVKAKVTLNPDGTVKLDGAEASGVQGKVTASGTAKLDGTSLVSAHLGAEILKRNALPLDAQGTDIGAVYGKFDVNVTTSDDRKAMTVAVDIPQVHVQLPDTSTNSVEELGELPDKNKIGVYTSPGRFTAVPLDGHESKPPSDAPANANSLTVAIKLGDAEIARGTDLRVSLGGNLTAKLDTETKVTGQIQLKTGKLDVQGKSFDIESGTVTFTGDPADPDVKVTAGWTAEDGTRVYADYTGPLKTGKVTLRSEPARPQNEIVALILFGTADGSSSTPYASKPEGADTEAGTTVGGFATGGLSKGLDKLTGLDITAKIDTSQANPRPEVEVQIARAISLELAFVLGTPPPGENPDLTYATIDWRFYRNWSLETTFGDHGSSLADVVWRRRY